MATKQFKINFRLEYQLEEKCDQFGGGVTVTDQEKDIVLKGFITDGKKERFDKNFGNYLQGEEPELEIEEIEDLKGNDVYDFVIENEKMEDLKNFVLETLGGN